MIDIVLCTTNSGKMAQFELLFESLKNEVRFLSLKDIHFDHEIEETGKTYEENSALKANTVCDQTGYISLGEDSGLEIDALPNFLGIYTARMGKGLTPEQKLNRVLDALKDVPAEKRNAHFYSVITCKFPNGDRLVTKGVLHGHISNDIRAPGTNMFYQPIFIPEGYDQTLSQMTPQQVIAINHRGQAARAFVEAFQNYQKTHQI